MFRLFNKRFAALTILITSSVGGYALFTPPAYSAKACQYWQVTASSVNVRDHNSTNAKIIDVLPKGTVVELHGYSQDGTWADISTQQYEGWVYANYLKCYKR